MGQECPFNPKEHMAHSWDFYLLRDDKKKFMFAAIHPHLIHCYGFYEGKVKYYRIEPKKIVEFFSLK